MTRFWDGQTDRRTDGRSDCTARPAFAFGDAGKKTVLYFTTICSFYERQEVLLFLLGKGSGHSSKTQNPLCDKLC